VLPRPWAVASSLPGAGQALLRLVTGLANVFARDEEVEGAPHRSRTSMVESPDEPLARLEDLQRPWGLRRTRDAPPFQRCAFEVCVARRAHLSFDQHAVGRRADDPAVRTATEPDRRHVLAADRARISSHPRPMPRLPALPTRLDVHTTVPASSIGVVARRAQAVAGGVYSGGGPPKSFRGAQGQDRSSLDGCGCDGRHSLRYLRGEEHGGPSWLDPGPAA
jgi:hypothetical protein